jgi:hypothetical protein
MKKLFFALAFILVNLLNAGFSQAINAATLLAWAEMPMHVYAPGPTAGQFNYEMEISPNKQMLQGFSATLKTDVNNQYYFLTDNGYGEKKNSADVLLRLYIANIDFSSADKKSNTVVASKFINFRDPDKHLTFPIQADFSHYYKLESNPAVDGTIIQNRLLTGADIDPESVQIDHAGNIWLGEEFGPFLIKLDASGKVMLPEISVPDVASPDNPNMITKPNLPSTGGFEGMAINPTGDILYPMLEATVMGDAEKSLRIYQFDTKTEQFADTFYRYQLDGETSIGDFIAINTHEFLVLERNDATLVNDNPVKKVYLIDINQISKAGFVQKRELVDLMRLDDPNDLNHDGKTQYAFAYSHIENLLLIDSKTLLIANDNNAKGSTYFIKVALDYALEMAQFNQPKLETSAWAENNLKPTGFDFGDHTFFGWATVLLYFIAALRTGFKAKLAKPALANQGFENSYFWISLTVLLILLGLNKQLDLQSNFTEMMRNMAKSHGWYDQRRGVQFAFVTIAGLAIPALIILLRVFLYNSWQRYKITWLGIVLLLMFILVRAASFHHVDTIFYKTIGSLRFYQALEMLAIGLIIVGTFFENKHAVTKKMNTAANILNLQTENDEVRCPKCYKKPKASAKHGRKFKCKNCKHVYQVHLSYD